MGFSTSVPVSFGGYGPRKSITKIPEKGLICRLLPSLHSCSVPGPNAGRWAILHKQHFGYDTTSASGDKSWNTFYCVEDYDYKTKTVLSPCPECENIKQQKATLDSAKKEYGFAGKTADEIFRLTEPLKNWVDKHNLDTKWYINVKTIEGTYTTLKIGTKVKKKLDGLIKELREPTRPGRPPIDLFDPADGVWLEFTRTGKGFDTEYDVRCATETKMVNVDGVSTPVEVYRKAPMADDEKEAAELTTYDLADVGIRRLTVRQVTELVQCGNNPDAIEAVFKAGQKVDAPKVAVVTPGGPMAINPNPNGQVGPAAETFAPGGSVLAVAGDLQQQQAAVAKAESLVAAVGNKTPPLSTEPGPRPGPKPVPAAMTDFVNMSIEELQARFGPPKA